METDVVLAPPNNVFLDPGYDKLWTYLHLDALQYVCEVVTIYCLQPKDVFLRAGRPGLRLVRNLLETGRLRVIAKQAHFELLERADLSEVQDAKARAEVKVLARELVKRSQYSFSDTLHVPTVRSLPDDFTELAVEFAVEKVLNNAPLLDYFRLQAERHRDQLPEFLRPDPLPRNGLVPLPEPLKSMKDEKLRVLGIPYDFFGDWLAMYQADVHIPLYRHAKWDEWYQKCWQEFAVEMPRGKWPNQVLKTAKPSPLTRGASDLFLPAMAELVHKIRLEHRVKAQEFRRSGGLQILQDYVWPTLMNCYSTYASAEERKGLVDSLFQNQQRNLKKLFNEVQLVEENKISRAWAVIKGVILPVKLLLDLKPVVGLIAELASFMMEGAYFSWRYRDSARRTKRFRSACKDHGIWLGLLVNVRALNTYGQVAEIEE